jgi:hypothetical protein
MVLLQDESQTQKLTHIHGLMLLGLAMYIIGIDYINLLKYEENY